MEPGIGRSLRQGFRAANRSWTGIGVFAGIWVAVIGTAIASIALTHPPRQLTQEEPVPSLGSPLPSPTDTAPSASGSSEPSKEPSVPATASQSSATADTKPTDLFKNLATAASPNMNQAPESIQAAARAISAATTQTLQATRDAREREARMVREWIARSWPVLLISLLCLIAANLWLTGSQVGYLAEQVARQSAKLSTFWAAGTQAFRSLLLASLVWLLGMAGLLLVAVLIALLFSVLGGKLPDWVLIVPGLLLMIGAVAGLLWAGVRLSLWFIAIVADRLGPIAGLKVSFHATRGRWWKTAGLGLLVALISYAVWLIVVLLEWIGNAIGGPMALIMGILGNVGGLVASLYIGFAGLAAFIQFYMDTKAAASSTPSLIVNRHAISPGPDVLERSQGGRVEHAASARPVILS